MNLHGELLEYLRRKATAMSLARIVEDLRKPKLEVELALSLLMKQRLVLAPRPGEYEAQRVALGTAPPEFELKPAGRTVVSITAEQAAAMLAAPITEEKPMAKGKKCDTCGVLKGATAYSKGSDKCRLCSKPTRGNGHAKTISDVAAKHACRNAFTDTVVLLRAEAAKFTAAADALEALGA